MIISFCFRFIPGCLLCIGGTDLYPGVLCSNQTWCALQERNCGNVWALGAHIER